jgi:RES domain-containing protein
MIVYRIAKTEERSLDLSGFGAAKFGGRWNSKGTYILYTSMNSSLAYLENLVHFSEISVPPNLYIASILINEDALVYELPDALYPRTWQETDNLENELIGDEWMRAKKFLAFKVRSTVNPSEFNFLLNPLFPGYHDMVTITAVQPLNIDVRLMR